MKTLKRKLCAILCAALLAGLLVPTASAATFIDTSDHWGASYIQRCADLGIVDGIGGGKFDPEGKVTNAAFVKMLCMAFFADEEKAFEAEHWNEIYNNFAGVLHWYSAMGYYFKVNSLLAGTTYTIITPEHADKPMDRNNMAQVAANVLVRKGIGVNDADLNAAQAKMPDYSTIPEGYRTAVKTCYALGVITGTDGGRFDGESTMTRAQACTVITRMLRVVEQGNTAEFAVKDIVVTQQNWSGNCPATPTQPAGKTSGTRWDIQDNGFPNGYLNNGKPITEENVLELLHKAEKIWPHGMTWTGSAASTGNNFYGNSGSVISSMLKTPNTGMKVNTNSNFACGGYSAMISDYLFGRDNNMYHQVTDQTKIRPGDTIIEIDPATRDVIHVMTAASSAITEYAPNGDPYPGRIYITDGNNGKKVNWSWPDEPTIGKYVTRTGEDAAHSTTGYRWLVFSRYPD